MTHKVVKYLSALIYALREQPCDGNAAFSRVCGGLLTLYNSNSCVFHVFFINFNHIVRKISFDIFNFILINLYFLPIFYTDAYVRELGLMLSSITKSHPDLSMIIGGDLNYINIFKGEAGGIFNPMIKLR